MADETIMPKSFFDRYQAGECAAVWADLVALDAGVRHELYLEDARAVARETMRRARKNVVTIIGRLEQLDYEFLDSHNAAAQHLDHMNDLDGMLRGTSMPTTLFSGLTHAAGQMGMDPQAMMAKAMDHAREQMAGFMPKLAEMKFRAEQRAAVAIKKPPLQDPAVYQLPPKNTAKLLAKLETMAGGPLPLSLKAWFEEVGNVCLMGEHPTLNPAQHPVAPDPLVMFPLDAALDWMGDEESDELFIDLSPDDLHKADISGGGPYCMRLPDAAADGKFLDERHNGTLVEYLRLSFEWGGFPGWEGSSDAPTKEIEFLREGLLPI